MLNEKTITQLWTGFAILIIGIFIASIFSFQAFYSGKAGQSLLFSEYPASILLEDQPIFCYFDLVSILSIIAIPLYVILFISKSFSIIYTLKLQAIPKDTKTTEGKIHNQILSRTLEILSDKK
jgi:hypothetical protein